MARERPEGSSLARALGEAEGSGPAGAQAEEAARPGEKTRGRRPKERGPASAAWRAWRGELDWLGAGALACRPSAQGRSACRAFGAARELLARRAGKLRCGSVAWSLGWMARPAAA